MLNRKEFLAATGAIALVGPPEMSHVKVGLAVQDVSYLNLYLAQSEGLWKKQGVDVEFVAFPGDAPVTQALVGGSVDLNIASMVGMLNLVAANLTDAQGNVRFPQANDQIELLRVDGIGHDEHQPVWRNLQSHALLELASVVGIGLIPDMECARAPLVLSAIACATQEPFDDVPEHRAGERHAKPLRRTSNGDVYHRRRN